jgi:hypothetical protein
MKNLQTKHGKWVHMVRQTNYMSGKNERFVAITQHIEGTAKHSP